MTAPGQEVVIRPPLPIRLLSLVFVLVGLTVFASWMIDDVRDGDFQWFLVIFGIGWVGIGLRTALVQARTSGGRLVVRNQLRTHTLERSAIEDVRVVRGSLFQQNRGGLDILLTDGGSLNVQGAMVLPFGGRQRSDEDRRRLLEWLGRPG